MSEKRFSETERNCYYTSLVFDNQTQEELGTNKSVKLLNALHEENKQLQKIGVMYQGHNPCSNCTYCLENKLCCGINPPMLCDEMKKDYFIYGLCKKHRQIQKSIRRYDDE